MRSQKPAAEVEELRVEECWRLLDLAKLGRLGTTTTDTSTGECKVDIFPVNFLVRDQIIFFRSGPGSKLMNIATHPQVAFEVDGLRRGTYWSVVVHGRALRMGLDRDIEASGVFELHAQHPTDKWNYVRIEADSISGIRFSA